MRRKNFTRRASLFLLAVMLLAVPANFYATPATTMTPLTTAAPVIQSNVGVNGFFSVDKAQRGTTVQAAIVLDIPAGHHVNANRPLGKYAVATTLKIEAPGGIKIGPVNYPRANVRTFSFSDEKLAVYEGRAVLRFNVSIPAGFDTGVTELRARLRYQSCTDELCFQPQTREVTMPIAIVGSNESVKRINGNIFGGGRRRK
jgi:hypothetical protein